jgi:hypothetical protein
MCKVLPDSEKSKTKKRTTRRKADPGAESGQVRILNKHLSEIRPSPENDKLYAPIDPTNPDNVLLRADVAQNGVKVPLTITLDNFIVNGHRRYWAARCAGLETVPCLYETFPRHLPDGELHPEFMPALARYNMNRVKTLDEVVREEVVLMNPEESYRLLVEHRRAASRADVQELPIIGQQRRAKISKAKRPFLDAILVILDKLKAFWPLSVRQIHYNLLNDPPLIHASKPDSRYRNTPQSYKSLDELLVRARFEGIIPFHAIQDKTRTVKTWNVWKSTGPFIRWELDNFLKGYYRDLMQSQIEHIEIIGEKNTIEGTIRPVAEENCIPYTLGRGYASVPPRKAMEERFQRSGKENLWLLFLTDHDPEGEDIPNAFAKSIRDDLRIPEHRIRVVKVGLTRDQVEELGLPPQMTAKTDSSRYDGFVDKYGDDVYELEAVPPGWLQEQLSDTIDRIIDVDAFNRELDAEKDDADHLDKVKGPNKTSDYGL